MHPNLPYIRAQTCPIRSLTSPNLPYNLVPPPRAKLPQTCPIFGALAQVIEMLDAYPHLGPADGGTYVLVIANNFEVAPNPSTTPSLNEHFTLP